jgi:hypothetical protein
VLNGDRWKVLETDRRWGRQYDTMDGFSDALNTKKWLK